MSLPSSAQPADRADPEVRRFVDAINEAYAQHSGEAAEGLEARRRIAERVRKPWREGGPPMAETVEFDMDGVRLRIHRPVTDATLPAMLYIHGGGWMLFSINTHDRLMREYAARAGVVVVGIDYSLAPEHRFPVALDECSRALDWMTAHAERTGLDAHRLLIGGDSVGANLSVATCLLRRQQNRPLPVAMLLNYGAFSPEHTPSYRAFGAGRYMLEADEMDDFWNAYVAQPAQLADPLVAPLRADLAGLPAAFVAVAECDILADSNRTFADRLKAAGVPTRCRTYAGATHSFLEAVSISSLADRALDEQAAWIGEVLGHDRAL